MPLEHPSLESDLAEHGKEDNHEHDHDAELPDVVHTLTSLVAIIKMLQLTNGAHTEVTPYDLGELLCELLRIRHRC
jgi:hypothetical protein